MPSCPVSSYASKILIGAFLLLVVSVAGHGCWSHDLTRPHSCPHRLSQFPGAMKRAPHPGWKPTWMVFG